MLEYNNQRLDYFESFECLLELPDSRAILDVKVASPGFNQNIILAITDSSLYQFSGEGVVRNVL